MFSHSHLSVFEFKKKENSSWKDLFDNFSGCSSKEYSYNQINSDVILITFAFESEEQPKTHYNDFGDFLNEHIQRLDDVIHTNTAQITKWRVLQSNCEEDPCQEGESAEKPRDHNVVCMIRHRARDVKQWQESSRLCKDQQISALTRAWCLMQNMDDPADVACSLRISGETVEKLLTTMLSGRIKAFLDWVRLNNIDVAKLTVSFNRGT